MRARRGRRQLSISGGGASHATLVDDEGTVLGVVEFLVRDPFFQRCLERRMRASPGGGPVVGRRPRGGRATLPGAALPQQCVARALYLHQHLVRRLLRRESRIESIIHGASGPRPCWHNRVLETLNDQRGFAQPPRDLAGPSVAGERRRTVEAGREVGVISSPPAPQGFLLQGLAPDPLLSAWDDMAGASRFATQRLPLHPPVDVR